MSKDLNQKIYIAGHRGMVGSAILRNLEAKGFNNFVTRTHEELDLTNQAKVAAFFEQEKPDQVYLAAARVGGIHANNTYPADFIYDNLMVQNNVIHHAFLAGVKRLLFLGSSCIYPQLANQPMLEDALLTGKLEPTNEPYAIAKIAGIKMCESYNRQYGASHGIDYRSVMPTNLYGPGDDFDPATSNPVIGFATGCHAQLCPSFIQARSRMVVATRRVGGTWCFGCLSRRRCSASENRWALCIVHIKIPRRWAAA